MFDTIFGLPLHVLVIHAVVVLLPLMALVTVLLALRPRWSERAAWLVVAGDVVVTGLAFLAASSGEALKLMLPANEAIREHAERGDLLPWFSVALVVAALGVLLLRRRGSGRTPLGVTLSAVVAVAVISWTVVVGHSGAQAAWAGVVSSASH